MLDVHAIGDVDCWMTPVFNYLTKGELSADKKEVAATKRWACSYVVLEQCLYQRGFFIPLLKCIEESKVFGVLHEIHEGIKPSTWVNDLSPEKHYGQDTIGPLCNKTLRNM